jgi:hypothetical protein
MGMQLRADESLSVPRPVVLHVVCDGDHGLLPAPYDVFDASDGCPRDPARRVGWRFTPDGLVLCPECRR